MTIRDVPSTDAHGDISTEREGGVYVIVLLFWFVALSLLLHEIFDIRPAAAQSACGAQTDIVKSLAKLHAETPQAIGLSADGKVIEVLVSPSGSWSILINHPDRRSCVVATGENWQSLPARNTDPAI